MLNANSARRRKWRMQSPITRKSTPPLTARVAELEVEVARLRAQMEGKWTELFEMMRDGMQAMGVRVPAAAPRRHLRSVPE
jgi:hypothetical protein